MDLTDLIVSLLLYFVPAASIICTCALFLWFRGRVFPWLWWEWICIGIPIGVYILALLAFGLDSKGPSVLLEMSGVGTIYGVLFSVRALVRRFYVNPSVSGLCVVAIGTVIAVLVAFCLPGFGST